MARRADTPWRIALFGRVFGMLESYADPANLSAVRASHRE
jgi:hypothetical protein